MPDYAHNQTSGPIEAGQVYDYTEDGLVIKVKVLEDTSVFPSGPLNFKLKAVESTEEILPVDTVFDVSAAEGHYAYTGMWRLWPENTYIR